VADPAISTERMLHPSWNSVQRFRLREIPLQILALTGKLNRLSLVVSTFRWAECRGRTERVELRVSPETPTATMETISRQSVSAGTESLPEQFRMGASPFPRLQSLASQ